MMKNLKTLLLLLLVSGSANLTFAQQLNTPAPSPGSTLKQSVGLAEVTLEYSRPSAKGRVIFGDLVPYGELWRTGANLATKFTVNKDLTFGSSTLKAGSYAILTKPDKDEWTLNFYPYESSGFGAYLEKTPSVSVTAKSYSMPDDAMVETLIMDINNITGNSASIDIIWANTYVSFPFTLATDAEVMAQINDLEKNTKSSMANNYYAAASYLLGEKKELEKALNYVNQAVEIRPEAFWMSRTQSQILAELGKYQEAVAAANVSLAAAKAAKNDQYVKFNEAAIADWTPKIKSSSKKK